MQNEPTFTITSRGSLPRSPLGDAVPQRRAVEARLVDVVAFSVLFWTFVVDGVGTELVLVDG